MTPSTEDGAGVRPVKQASPLEMSTEEMRALGRHVTDLLVRRLETLATSAPWKGAPRSELEPVLREDPPEEGRPAREVVDRAVREILPVAGRVDHPRFFAFVPSSPTWPGILADYLSAGFNIFQGTWLGSSGPSQAELVVVDWFRKWLGYPETAGGLFTSGGSAASLDALVAAREAAGAPAGPTVYMSDQSHTALVRAARIVGVPGENIRMVPSDDAFRLRMDALKEAVEADRQRGFTPIAVCANAGATNTGAVDPLEEMAGFCAREGIWLHVDAAYGGFAMVTEAGRHLLRGMERADSVTLDAHKWLFQPFEAGCLMVKDVRRLESAFSVRPEYLQDTELGMEHVNFADRGLQLTRSFRALKVWMSIQTFGMAAFRSSVALGIELAERAAAFVKASSVLELLSPPSLGVACFRYRPRDTTLDEEALERVNAGIQARIIGDETAMMSSTRLRGTYALRLCILNHRSTWTDVEDTLRTIERVGAEEVAGNGGRTAADGPEAGKAGAGPARQS